MTDTIRELILRILDYVEKTPGAHFSISRWLKGVRKPDENQMLFDFSMIDEKYHTHYISRGNRLYWSAQADLTEDNLRYLLSQLEEEK